MNHRFPIHLACLILTTGMLAAQSHDLTTLMPRPKEAYARTGSITVTGATPIYLSTAHDPALAKHAGYLLDALALRLGSRPPIRFIDDLGGAPDGGKIIIEYLDPLRRDAPELLGMNAGERLPGPEGYLLNITPATITIAGRDADGVFHGITTLLQLMNHVGMGETLPCVHVMDYPDYPVRWVFSQHNLRGAGAIGALGMLIDTMAFYKLNGIQQNDFKYQILDQQPRNYFDSVDALKRLAAHGNLEIIPGVAQIGYSEGILWHDPNLAEGFPATATYVIRGDTGRLIPDPNVTLPNGSFESIGGNGKLTGWSFYDDPAVTVDHTIFHGGSASARCENFASANAAGNCRFNRRVDCRPHSYYHMSAWIRTEDLAGTGQLLAIGVDDSGASHPLTYTAYNVAGTGGWRKVEVLFNSLRFNHLLLYAGVWGGTRGKIWWDDFTIEEAGLVNVLRRPGTPLAVSNRSTGALYREGIDFDPIADSVMEKSHGYYGYHAPATLHRRAGGRLANGDTVTVSFFHAMTTISDETIQGSVMICPSEDTLYTILSRQIAGVDSLYGGYGAMSLKPAPPRFFLGHDEIRAMNRDSACLRRGMSPAALLADNLTRCAAIVEKTRPGAGTYVWSDMFDSLHNAYNDYYLIDGDLGGVWDAIPRSTTIVNWNGGAKRDASLRFFAGHGFRQITSPYYDAGNNDGIRAWRLSMEKVENIDGMMYTTWNGDYRHLVPFAYYAWGAGPYIIHQPLDSATFDGAGGRCFRATIMSDPYDPGDRITEASVRLHYPDGSQQTLRLDRDGVDLFSTCNVAIDAPEFAYEIVATNSQGIERSTSRYILHRSGIPAGIGESEVLPGMTISIAPNPARGSATLDFTAWRRGEWELRVTDLLGRDMLRDRGECAAGANRITLDLASFPSGLYRCEIVTGGARRSAMLGVAR